MKNPLKIDNALVGGGAELSVLLVAALLEWGVVTLLGYRVADHLQWMAFPLIPGILLVRYYAKAKEYPKATKASMIVFAVATIAFIAYLLKNRII